METMTAVTLGLWSIIIIIYLIIWKLEGFWIATWTITSSLGIGLLFTLIERLLRGY